MRSQRAQAWLIVGPALIWTVHLLAAYAIGEWTCVQRGTLFVWLGVPASLWGLALLSVLCLTTSLWLTFKSHPLAKAGPEWSLARIAYYSGFIFSFAILAQAVPVFYVWYGC